jgi:hypothetical protein
MVPVSLPGGMGRADPTAIASDTGAKVPQRPILSWPCGAAQFPVASGDAARLGHLRAAGGQRRIDLGEPGDGAPLRSAGVFICLRCRCHTVPNQVAGAVGAVSWVRAGVGRVAGSNPWAASAGATGFDLLEIVRIEPFRPRLAAVKNGGYPC